MTFPQISGQSSLIVITVIYISLIDGSLSPWKHIPLSVARRSVNRPTRVSQSPDLGQPLDRPGSATFRMYAQIGIE